MAKHFKTYFGVPIPPFKEEKLGAGSKTIRFVISGNVISKKNNQQAIAVRAYAKKFLFEQQQKNGIVTLADALKAVNMVKGKMRGNVQYLEFLKKHSPIIMAQMQEWSNRLSLKGLIFPLTKANCSIRLYIKDRYRRDTLNAMQTISDLLVDAGVIVDDDDLHFNPVYGASARYYEELVHNIAFISLSFRL